MSLYHKLLCKVRIHFMSLLSFNKNCINKLPEKRHIWTYIRGSSLNLSGSSLVQCNILHVCSGEEKYCVVTIAVMVCRLYCFGNDCKAETRAGFILLFTRPDKLKLVFINQLLRTQQERHHSPSLIPYGNTESQDDFEFPHTNLLLCTNTFKTNVISKGS